MVADGKLTSLLHRERTRTKKVVQEGKYLGVRHRAWVGSNAEIRDPHTHERKWLGMFDTAEQAALAYDLATRSMRGGKPQTSFIDPMQQTPSCLLSSTLAMTSQLEQGWGGPFTNAEVQARHSDGGELGVGDGGDKSHLVSWWDTAMMTPSGTSYNLADYSKSPAPEAGTMLDATMQDPFQQMLENVERLAKAVSDPLPWRRDANSYDFVRLTEAHKYSTVGVQIDGAGACITTVAAPPTPQLPPKVCTWSQLPQCQGIHYDEPVWNDSTMTETGGHGLLHLSDEHIRLPTASQLFNLDDNAISGTLAQVVSQYVGGGFPRGQPSLQAFRENPISNRTSNNFMTVTNSATDECSACSPPALPFSEDSPPALSFSEDSPPALSFSEDSATSPLLSPSASTDKDDMSPAAPPASAAFVVVEKEEPHCSPLCDLPSSPSTKYAEDPPAGGIMLTASIDTRYEHPDVAWQTFGNGCGFDECFGSAANGAVHAVPFSQAATTTSSCLVAAGNSCMKEDLGSQNLGIPDLYPEVQDPLLLVLMEIPPSAMPGSDRLWD